MQLFITVRCCGWHDMHGAGTEWDSWTEGSQYKHLSAFPGIQYSTMCTQIHILTESQSRPTTCRWQWITVTGFYPTSPWKQTRTVPWILLSYVTFCLQCCPSQLVYHIIHIYHACWHMHIFYLLLRVNQGWPIVLSVCASKIADLTKLERNLELLLTRIHSCSCCSQKKTYTAAV